PGRKWPSAGASDGPSRRWQEHTKSSVGPRPKQTASYLLHSANIGCELGRVRQGLIMCAPGGYGPNYCGFTIDQAHIRWLRVAAKLKHMRAVNDRGAKLDCLDRILSTMFDQRSAHEHDRRLAIEQAEFAHGLSD